jgi:hypothetical protein
MNKEILKKITQIIINIINIILVLLLLALAFISIFDKELILKIIEWI